MNGKVYIGNTSGGSLATSDIPFILADMHSTLAEQQGKPAESFKGTVLVVEDDVVLSALAAKQLCSLGYKAQVVLSGQDAIEAVKSSSFDLILIDCYLPEMDGLQTVKALRKLEHGRRVPTIAFTAAATPGYEKECLEAGMDDFLSKPVTLEQLKRKLDQWIPTTDAT